MHYLLLHGYGSKLFQCLYRFFFFCSFFVHQNNIEQVKDICNELEVRSLCHKILQNVSILLKADRGSLFLVQGKSTDSSSPDASKK